MLRHPLFFKLLALGTVLVALLIALGAIEGVVRERLRYRETAIQSVAQSLAGDQALLGPLVHRACTETWTAVEGEGASRRTVEHRRERVLTAMPAVLQLQSGAAIDERARGIYPVSAYTLKARVTARFDDLAALQPDAVPAHANLQCGAPIAMLAVADPRGIRSAALTVAGQPVAAKAGTFHPQHPRGLHAQLPAGVLQPGAAPLEIALDLELVGTQRIGFVPVGADTQVQLASPWPHPSFEGRFLPAERRIGADGFDARWRVSALASSAAEDVRAGRGLCTDGRSGCAESFGVAFIDPVNPWVLSDRATKYGALFIGLTFLAVGIVELLRRLRVHPVQYLLVGAAVAIFFLLLVSLSEHIGFAPAYAAAAGACAALVGFYGASVLGHWRRGAALGAAVGLLYALLFGLLRLEQTALAVGAVTLFAVLAAVMAATRRIDWYGLGR